MFQKQIQSKDDERYSYSHEFLIRNLSSTSMFVNVRRDSTGEFWEGAVEASCCQVGRSMPSWVNPLGHSGSTFVDPGLTLFLIFKTTFQSSLAPAEIRWYNNTWSDQQLSWIWTIHVSSLCLFVTPQAGLFVITATQMVESNSTLWKEC